MVTKASISLRDYILQKVDEHRGTKSRSEFIEELIDLGLAVKFQRKINDAS